MILIDAHVHFYDCFNLDLFFDSALANFRKAAAGAGVINQPFSSLLLLTEGASGHWFQDLAAKSQTGRHADISKWAITPTGDGLSLTVCRHDAPAESTCLVAGRQIVTVEKLEVLALFCNTRIDDGLPLNETVRAIRQLNGIPVIPWGVGKWFGQRGKTLHSFLAGYQGAGLFLGDNGGRPQFWPTPALFHLAREKGISILPGTDPLPLPHEAVRVGSFGCIVDHPPLRVDAPAVSMRDLLLSGREAILPFGQLQKTGRFFKNQLQLRSWQFRSFS